MNYLEYQEYPDYLMHYGVKGQKWGVRRYQNKDGSLTAAGKKKYSGGSVWKTTGKVDYTDGSTGYVTAIGTRNAKSGGNIGGVYGRGKTRKESIKDAEAQLVKHLNKRNDDRYESNSTQKLRDKVQKEAYSELKKHDHPNTDYFVSEGNTKSKALADGIKSGKKAMHKYLDEEAKAGRMWNDARNREYTRLQNEYKSTHKVKDIDSDTKYELYEQATANSYRQPDVQKALGKAETARKQYYKQLRQVSNEILGKYKDTPVRKLNNGRVKTATDVLDSIVLNRTLDDIDPDKPH